MRTIQLRHGRRPTLTLPPRNECCEFLDDAGVTCWRRKFVERRLPYRSRTFCNALPAGFAPLPKVSPVRYQRLIERRLVPLHRVRGCKEMSSGFDLFYRIRRTLFGVRGKRLKQLGEHL